MREFLLLLLRPLERFLPDWIALSTQPISFVRNRIRLGDESNFLRATNFFLLAVSLAFLAEVATVWMLGIGSLVEPIYWLFAVVTSIPFIVICFLLVRPFARISPKGALHLTLHPLGAGIFSGAVLGLVAAAVVSFAIATGYITDITYDFTKYQPQYSETRVSSLIHLMKLECIKERSLTIPIIAAGFGEAYSKLKWPLDWLSYVQPFVRLFYLFIAALFFVAAANGRKVAVFCAVILAAVVSTTIMFYGIRTYIHWVYSQHPECEKQIAARAFELNAPSLAQLLAKSWNDEAAAKPSDIYEVTIRAEGRTLIHTERLKMPLTELIYLGQLVNDAHSFQALIADKRLAVLSLYCARDAVSQFRRKVVSQQVFMFYNMNGMPLGSFTISPKDCFE